ncbi:hypothetical protein CSUI_001982 [Cystoisospora suis]|uniref:Uncharacterized protein n=1 Tax=Cystoisospora suis TaxID=483139 RepID=A0A2C6L6G4_9APIC|nr:hypothetical protein CSUI_001982 [Cystoisospora suis]
MCGCTSYRMAARVNSLASQAPVRGEDILGRSEFSRLFSEQSELLASAAPSLGPCPLLLCYPVSACECLAVPELTPKSSPSLSGASCRGVTPAKGDFAKLQLRKYTREACSLARAVREAFSGPLNTAEFSACFKSSAEAALRNMRRCDFCGVEQQPYQAKHCPFKGRDAAKKKGRTDTEVPGDPLQSAAVCVVPRVDPETRAVILTSPKVACSTCIQVLHLPHLLALSVQSVAAPTPETCTLFSRLLEHFCVVNRFSMSEGGGRLQDSLSLAFSIFLQMKQERWHIQRLSHPSLDAFFHPVTTSALPCPSENDTVVRESSQDPGTSAPGRACHPRRCTVREAKDKIEGWLPEDPVRKRRKQRGS